MSKSFLFALLYGLALAVLNQAQDQSGFISIDCGLPAPTHNIDSTTGISYISYASFINSGVNKTVQDEFKNDYQRYMWSLRSFLEGKRNCYKINVTHPRYLIRATFLYGNYDGLNDHPIFDLYLGANI
ncbi:hypothetical protein L6164_028804 [Bauhinia variegata]|uniref:Uncharacterized protein n=1 Tax=Bauhinia variegata TaxID=167791 RepID=A0ACB9L7K1_BAUVA|nr:hypothetical protein L6164_028804 [Bauhinia variegata]